MTSVAPPPDLALPESPHPEVPSSKRGGKWRAGLAVAVLIVFASAFFLYLLVPIVALLFHAPLR